MSNSNNPLLNFQYKYTKLFTIGFNRKKFEIQSTKDRLWAINNSKNTLLAILFTLFGSVFIFSGLIELSENKTQVVDMVFIIVLFVVHPLVGLICLRQLLWLINGKQELIIENGNRYLTKRGTFFTRTKTYDLNRVKNIRQAIDEDQLSLFQKIKNNIALNQKVLLRHVIGQILFEYQYDTIKVFNDLDSDEKNELISEMIKRKDEVAKAV
jgi:hypothetical protein